MKLKKETRRKLLLLYVRFFHRGQKSKVIYGEVYYKQPLRVAKSAMKFYPTGVSFEIGLCHDLFNNTSCTPSRLGKALKFLGYNLTETAKIVHGVEDLTNEYTYENYPQYSRSERNRREAIRLSQSTKMIQTIKYCDFKDNMLDINKMDIDYALMLLNERCFSLSIITDGDKKLRTELLADAETYLLLLKNYKY